MFWIVESNILKQITLEYIYRFLLYKHRNYFDVLVGNYKPMSTFKDVMVTNTLGTQKHPDIDAALDLKQDSSVSIYDGDNSVYFVKAGNLVFLHCMADEAIGVIHTLSKEYRPKYHVSVSGWCQNKSNNRFYPCIGGIRNIGEWSYLSAINSFSDGNLYYLYSATEENKLLNFLVWLSGSWVV